MKIGKIILLNILFVLLLSIGVSAAGKYIVDDANVLKQDTINTVEQNLEKVEKNTEVTVKFDIIKSLNGKSIDDYSKQYAKDNIKGDQYILFVTSIGDRKNKILVGSKANSILSQSDIENIASLPNQDFKANNFDAGIIKVGKAIDEKVTTKAVKSGKAEVVKDGYSSTVQHKTDYSGIITIILIIVVIGIILFMAIKRKINDDYEKRKKKFAQDNNLESYLDSDNNSFHSADVNKSDTTYSSSNDSSNYNSTERNRDANSRMYNNSYGANGNSSFNNTTIIHEHGNNSFVEGMVVGEMLSEEHNHHHHHDDYEDDYRRERSEPEKSYNNDTSTYTSGDWDTGSTSSWDNSSNDSDSSTWDSSSSGDSTSSSWDSSSSSWDSSSNDSKSSDW